MASASRCHAVLTVPSSTPSQRLVGMASWTEAELLNPLYIRRDWRSSVQHRIRVVDKLSPPGDVPKASYGLHHSQHARPRCRLTSQASLACHSSHMRYLPAASHSAVSLKKFDGLRVIRARRDARSRTAGSFRDVSRFARAAADSAESPQVSLVEVSSTH